MNKKIIVILLFFISFNLNAQSQRQTTEKVWICMPERILDYSGTMTYSYTVDDQGERIKNGPISITGSRNDTYGNVSIRGSYKLTASCKDNYLNGAFSVVAKYHAEQRIARKVQQTDEEYTMKGSFLNGIPNGNFTAKITGIGSSNVNYKNGLLVGAYSIDGIMLNSGLYESIKGNLDNNGRLVGKWHFETIQYGSGTMEFVKGILISRSMKSIIRDITETPDSQVLVAKQYASGAISLEELKDRGIIVAEDSLQLYNYACDMFFHKRLVDWSSNIGYCDFSRSKMVKYNYLLFLGVVSEEQLSSLISLIEKQGYSNSLVYDPSLDSYKLGDALLSREQVARIKNAIDQYNRHNAYSSFFTFCKEWNSSNNKEKKNGESLDLQGIINLPTRFDELKQCTDLSQAQEKYNSIVIFLDALDKLKAQMTPTEDEAYYVIQLRKDSLRSAYVTADAINEIVSLEQEIRDYGASLPERVATAKAALKAHLIGIISPILDRMIDLSEYNELMDSWQDYYLQINKPGEVLLEEFVKAISPLCAYEILDVENNNLIEVSLRFVKKSADENITIPVSLRCDKTTGKIVSDSVALPAEVLGQIREQKRIEEKVAYYRSVCKQSLEGLVGKSKASELVYAKNGFYTENGVTPDNKDLYKIIKPYSPIIEVFIESIDQNSIDSDEIHLVALITKSKGRKQIVYRVPLTADSRGRIRMSDLNIKNAIKIED